MCVTPVCSPNPRSTGPALLGQSTTLRPAESHATRTALSRSGFKLGTAGMVETATILIYMYLALTHHGEGNKRRGVVCAEKEGWEGGGGGITSLWCTIRAW
ncbi:hypothetical protein RRG08_065137 [Elysia crispata]|uniref:Uncharacterized protein n=1 Tax=Elysia crispata TaxID=231223 RepID=A0AAE0ZAK6_9GAST|nr:hypothetical protein RRG08_065137 [Elysia crispata]